METEFQRQARDFCDFRTDLRGRMEILGGEFVELRNTNLALNKIDLPGFIQHTVREGIARHATDNWQGLQEVKQHTEEVARDVRDVRKWWVQLRDCVTAQEGNLKEWMSKVERRWHEIPPPCHRTNAPDATCEAC